MTLLSQLAAIVGTGVVYGTNAFCALAQRPALARSTTHKPPSWERAPFRRPPYARPGNPRYRRGRRSGRAAQTLQAAFAAGGAAAAAPLMSADVVHDDMAGHTRVRGQLQAQRYCTRALGQLPHGPGAALVHAEGSSQGGGYD